MKNKLGLIKRLSLLAVLLFCLGFVAFTPDAQPALASICCSQCPLPPPYDVEDVPAFCANQCGGTSDRDCLADCAAAVKYCAGHCDHGC